VYLRCTVLLWVLLRYCYEASASAIFEPATTTATTPTTTTTTINIIEAVSEKILKMV